MAHVITAYMEKVLNVSKRQRKANIQHHRQANDLWTGLEIPKWGALGHQARLDLPPARLNSVSSEKTHLTAPKHTFTKRIF